MRILVAISLAVCFFVGAAFAQDAAQPTDQPTDTPIVRAEIAEDSVAVGQPVVFRVTILVPTWMPSPPEFPSFEIPNMIVRLPERASGPVSERVNGETWSGVSRAYRLYPMVAGNFVLPQQVLRLTYADPETSDPIRAEMTIPALGLTATVPEGAENLDPLIVAESLELEQVFDGPKDVLAEGEAVKRKVTARIKGSSALFIPPLIPELENVAAQAYADEAIIKETEDRGVLSGQRSETVTYVARFGGNLELPEISFEWFNIKSGKVETATLNGAVYAIDAPAPERVPLLTPRQIALVMAGVLALALVGWALHRWAWPLVHAGLRTRKQRHLASEVYAADQVKKAIRAHDLHRVAATLTLWEARLPTSATPQDVALETALLRAGAARYRSAQNGAEPAADWPDVTRAFDKARKARLDARRREKRVSALPPLNPF